MKCSNCNRTQKSDRFRRGRCMSCYRYFLQHGHDRPPEQRRRRKDDPPKLCTRCRQAFAIRTKTLCDACYQYKRVTGRNRPRHLWAEQCKQCGKPRQRGFTGGLCAVCYNYRRRYGRDRPIESIKTHAPLGYCDCGQPAVSIVKIRLHTYQHEDDMPLCSDCIQYEQELTT